MIYYYDLHIHSILSPCSEVLNTPNNILNMAYLKKLNIISVTDHNSLKQQKTILNLAKSYNILAVPGVEVTVNEGFHVLVYLKNEDDIDKFDEYLERHLIKEELDLSKYHKEIVMDVYDNEVSFVNYSLNSKLDVNIKDLLSYLKGYETLIYFAHVDRPYASGKDYLKDVKIDGIELINQNHEIDFLGYQILYNSDAHNILNMNEQDYSVELSDLTIESLFEVLKNV